MGWLYKLQKRWELNSLRQVVLVLIVFACTGFTVFFLKKPIMAWIANSGDDNLLYSVAYYVLILPVYNAILLVYGFIFGQFHFFWRFEKKMWQRMTGRGRHERTK